MKKGILYGGVLIVIFSIGFFMSYKIFLENSRVEVEKNDLTIKQNENVELSQGKQDEEEIEPIVKELDNTQEVAAEIERITPSTKLIIQQYYLSNDNMIENEMIPPYYFIDKTREDIIKYAETYLKNPTEEEFDSGLMHYELISFSPREVILRKTYDNASLDEYFFVTIKDGTIIIYYDDKETIREHTNIYVETLMEEELELLRNGRMIYGEDELYELLENYSS